MSHLGGRQALLFCLNDLCTYVHTDIHGLLKLYMICVGGEVIGMSCNHVLQTCVFRSKHAMLIKESGAMQSWCSSHCEGDLL